VSNEKETTDQPLILAIETATRAGGVAVARGEAILAAIAGEASISHSTNLLEMIDAALQQAGAALQDVEVFAVASGPGSFTGLRIGVATAKAFGVHLQRQLIGVSTLAAVAHASQLEGNVVALLPAGRGEVFAQWFKVAEGMATPVDQPQHLSPRALLEKYSAVEELIFAGDGAPMIEFGGGQTSVSVEGDGKHHRVKSVPLLLAPSIAVLGYREYSAGRAVAPQDLHAVYVRASDAEINERWQQQKLQQPASN
jgi:tRNA threonylcarbamoyladenosine biosynthesis protein TsaB